MIDKRVDYYTNGNIAAETWFKDGVIHRDYGPAITYFYNASRMPWHPKERLFYTNGKLHNLCSPAIIRYDKSRKILEEEFWMNGERFNMDKYLKDNNCSWPLNEEQELLFIMQYG